MTDTQKEGFLIKRLDRLQNENNKLRDAAVRQTAIVAALVGLLVANGTITREDSLVVIQAGVDDTDEMTDPKKVMRWLRHELLHGKLRKGKDGG